MFVDDPLFNSLFSARNFESLFDGLVSGGYMRSPVSFKEGEDGSSCLTVDLPGVKKDDLQVEVSGKVVTIKAERKTKTSTSSYNRSFTLSDKYDANSLQADLEDGVLTLTVAPKLLEEKSARKVLINSK